MADEIGRPERQFGPYRLVRQIATGGMAEIHLAATKGLGGFEKVVALKMIHPNFSSDDHFVQMLIDEAKISVQLQHVNIAHVFDLGKVGDTYYIAMEFVDGCDLFKVLRKASEKDRYMPVETACYIAKEVCSGLDYAHHKRDAAGRSLGIVHRDVSPQNVLLSHAGEVKLVDFGIAKATMRARQTAVGVIKGKYYYMSPEQAWGDPVDHRTDIFSAGILLYEMLTGQMLYLEEDMNKLLDMVRKADIAPPSTKRPEVPRELDRIVMRALAKKSDLRWQSAHDFGTAIETFLLGFAPDFSAQRLAGFVNEIVPPAVPARPAISQETARAPRAREPIMVSPSEFADENSVLFRLGQRREETQEMPARPPPRPPARPSVSANRLTTPSALPPRAPSGKHPVAANRLTTPSGGPPIEKTVPARTVTLDETRAAKTLVSQPGFASVDSGTIEISADMLEPVEPAVAPSATTDATTYATNDATNDTTTDVTGNAADTIRDPPSDTISTGSSSPAIAQPPATPAAPPMVPPVPLTRDIDATPPLGAAAPEPRPRRSRRTPGAGIPISAPVRQHSKAARLSAPLPLPPDEESAPHVPVRSTSPSTSPPPASPAAAAVWPPPWGRGAEDNWSEDDFFGMRIGGRFDKKKLLVAAVLVAITVGLGAFAVAAFSSGREPPPRADASLEIISIPAGAHITVDGKEVGMTPLRLDRLPIGKPVTVKLELERFQSWQRSEPLSDPGDVKLVASLRPILGTLHVESLPVGAEVFFNNRSLGKAPLVRADMNPYVDGTVEVRKQGFRPSRQGLRWEGQREATLKFELQPTSN